MDEEVGDDFDDDIEPSKDNTEHYGFRPRQLIDLIPIVDHYRASESASVFDHRCTSYTRRPMIRLHKIVQTISYKLMLEKNLKFLMLVTL